MGDNPKSPIKTVRLDVKSNEPSIPVETSSPLRQSLQLNTDDLSPPRPTSMLKQSFYRPLTPKSTSPMLISSSSYRSPAKSLKRKPSLRCESMEDISNTSRSRGGSIIRTKSFTYGYSWNGSDSDLSQLSSANNTNSFLFMNTMQQSLGVVLKESPLTMLIASLRTSTRDSFDGNSKLSAINITASLENINFSMNYKQFNKTAAEVGDIHLELLHKVCMDQLNSIVADLQSYNQEVMTGQKNQVHLGIASHDENHQRLEPMVDESIIRASLDEAQFDRENEKDRGITNVNPNESMIEETTPSTLTLVRATLDATPFAQLVDDSLPDIQRVGSTDSHFSQGLDDPNHRPYDDSSSDSTVNNHVTRRSDHPGMMNITPSISNNASEDMFDNLSKERSLSLHREDLDEEDDDILREQPQKEPTSIVTKRPEFEGEEGHSLQVFPTTSKSKSAELGLPPPPSSSRSASQSLPYRTQYFLPPGSAGGSSDPLISEIDIGIHEYSAILYRYIDLACTHSEILQLQNKEDEAILSLLYTFYYTNLFVHKYLSDWETLLLFASLEDEEEESRVVQFSFTGEIMSGMDGIFHQLCQERKIDWSKDPFVQGFLILDEKSPPFYTSPPSYSNAPTSFHPPLPPPSLAPNTASSSSSKSDRTIPTTTPAGHNNSSSVINTDDWDSEEELTPKMTTTTASSTIIQQEIISSEPQIPSQPQTQQQPHPFKRQFSSDVNLVMNLESLCLVLSKYDHSHTLYAIAHGIRRLGVLLKSTGKLKQALTAIQTCIHIFEVMETIYTNTTIDLSSCYALLASILDEMNSHSEAMDKDRKGLELSAVGKFP